MSAATYMRGVSNPEVNAGFGRPATILIVPGSTPAERAAWEISSPSRGFHESSGTSVRSNVRPARNRSQIAKAIPEARAA